MPQQKTQRIIPDSLKRTSRTDVVGLFHSTVHLCLLNSPGILKGNEIFIQYTGLTEQCRTGMLYFNIGGTGGRNRHFQRWYKVPRPPCPPSPPSVSDDYLVLLVC